MNLPEDEIPLVVARAVGGYTLFCYKEQDPTPRLVEHQLDSVPAELKSYEVAYPLVGAKASPSSTTTTSDGRPAGRRSYYGESMGLPTHLRNLAVIDSKFSGSHRSSGIYFAILLPLLKAFGLAHVYVSTASQRTIPDHAKSFSSSSTVIFLAGDTSIHEFINSLAETREPLRLTVAAVPTGTGNALSNSIGHLSVAHAISRIFTGQAQHLANSRIDFPRGSVLTGTDEPVQSLRSLMVMSWGFHASIVADSDSAEYRKLGASRFQKAAAYNLETRLQRYHGTIQLASSTRVFEGPHAYVLFTLVKSLEPTFVISPSSTPPPDQQLHLVHFDEVASNSEIMDLMYQAYDKGKHVHDSRVDYQEMVSGDSNGVVARIKVDESDEARRRWCVDGRIVTIGDKTTNDYDNDGNDSCVEIYKPSCFYNGWELFIVT